MINNYIYLNKRISYNIVVCKSNIRFLKVPFSSGFNKRKNDGLEGFLY